MNLCHFLVFIKKLFWILFWEIFSTWISHYSSPWKRVSGVVLRLDSLRKLRLFLCHTKNIFLYFFTELKNLPSSLFYLQTKLMLMSHQHWNPWQLQLALRCSATKLLTQQILGVNGFYKLCTKASKWHTTILGSRKSSNFWCSTSSSITSVPINISWKNLCIHL